MKVFIMLNLSRKTAYPCTVDTIHRLQGLQIDVLLDWKHRASFAEFKDIHYRDGDEALEECDFVIAIGGDGTIMHSAKHAMQKNKPVFGINAGRLGFLASLETDELEHLEDLITGNYSIDRRMMLKVTHHTKDGADSYFALNDAVIAKGALAKIVDLGVSCDGQKIISHRADGIIFSTPTGSTAYSLAAGGPVIDPNIDCISMTPICSHSLMGRSIIFSDDKVLEASANIDEEHEAYLSVDGENDVKLSKGDTVTIEKSEIFIHFVKFTDKPFYEILNEKILEKMCD